MQLCKLLGIIDRPTLYATLTHVAYREWMELWECDPWDEDRADLRAGIIASAAVSPYAGKGRVPKPLDFMPYAKFNRGKQQQSVEEMKSIWDAANRAAVQVRKQKDR